MGDFNGDGKPDVFAASPACSGNPPIVTCNYTGVVFAGNGDGTFHMIGTGINLNPLGGVLSYVTVSDFNGDGNADVAVTLDNSSTHVFSLTIYTGNGDGTFRTGATYVRAISLGALRGERLQW